MNHLVPNGARACLPPHSSPPSSSPGPGSDPQPWHRPAPPPSPGLLRPPKEGFHAPTAPSNWLTWANWGTGTGPSTTLSRGSGGKRGRPEPRRLSGTCVPSHSRAVPCTPASISMPPANPHVLMAVPRRCWFIHLELELELDHLFQSKKQQASHTHTPTLIAWRGREPRHAPSSDPPINGAVCHLHLVLGQ